jgi:hypothetical protein
MTISQLSNTALSTTASATQTATQASNGTNAVAQAMKKADARLQSQVDTTGTQLSSLGKLKSAVADMQASAHALGGLTAASPAADVKAAASSFIAAFNTSLGSAKAAASAMGTRQVGGELARSVSANSANLDALKKIGFKQLADGSLSLDAGKLDAALKADPAGVQAALGKLGQAADAVATKELATGGHVAAPLASLTQRAGALKTQQNALLAMVKQFDTSTATQGSSYLASSIAAYKASV